MPFWNPTVSTLLLSALYFMNSFLEYTLLERLMPGVTWTGPFRGRARLMGMLFWAPHWKVSRIFLKLAAESRKFAPPEMLVVRPMPSFSYHFGVPAKSFF